MGSPFIGNSYTLTPVAETGAQFSGFAPYVGAIDSRGLVAFQAALAEGGSGVYTSDGESITTVAESAAGTFAERLQPPGHQPGWILLLLRERRAGRPGRAHGAGRGDRLPRRRGRPARADHERGGRDGVPRLHGRGRRGSLPV